MTELMNQLRENENKPWVKRKVYKYSKKLLKKIRFMRDFNDFRKLQIGSNRFRMIWKDRYPILNENTTNSVFDSHYIYHPAWAARILSRTLPSKHIDISSSLHFCTMISAFIPVEFYDYRPAKINLSDLSSKYADLMNLPFPNNSIESLSSMHVLEHIGLGRYGEPLDPEGDIKAFAELKRVLAKNGSLIIVVPLGVPIIRFNAHRIYSYDQIFSYFSDLSLIDFALVTDEGEFINNATQNEADQQNYGCGCWYFVKRN
ncbi:MAG TPA: DUF268 domain-containing protein [Anaerolineales bacterium]|nr:DUF268 domain-containing protein [Anaerolineales bacterium]